MKVYTKITSPAKKTATRCLISQQSLEQSKILFEVAENEGLYRTGKKELSAEQLALKQTYFDGYTFQYMVTIRMSYRSEEGYTRTKNYSTAQERYCNMLCSFEEQIKGKNWKRHPLHIVGALENGKDEEDNDMGGFYHIHFLILTTRHSFEEIINALQFVEDKYDLGSDGIEIDEIYCENGAVLYLLKEQGYKSGKHEFCEVFNTVTLCKKPMPRKHIEEPKFELKEETKEESKEEVNKESIEEIKEESKVEYNDEPKDELKSEPKKRKKLSVKIIKKYIICIKKKIIKTVVKLTQNLLYNSFYGIYT